MRLREWWSVESADHPVPPPCTTPHPFGPRCHDATMPRCPGGPLRALPEAIIATCPLRRSGQGCQRRNEQEVGRGTRDTVQLRVGVCQRHRDPQEQPAHCGEGSEQCCTAGSPRAVRVAAVSKAVEVVHDRPVRMGDCDTWSVDDTEGHLPGNLSSLPSVSIPPHSRPTPPPPQPCIQLGRASPRLDHLPFIQHGCALCVLLLVHSLCAI
jgi:hypothetical protein